MRPFGPYLLIASIVASIALASSARAQTPPPYSEALGPPRASWSASDEAWLRTNRRVAIAGKVLTVLGRMGVVAALVASSESLEVVPYLGAAVVANTGELMWSIADLRATNRLERRGAEIRRAAAITSLVGALTLVPLTWITGPIASARIRAVHGDLLSAQNARSGRGLRVYGASLSFRF